MIDAIPDGATTTYTYTYYNPTTQTGANTQTAALDGRWQTTTLDGFGRPIRVQKGNGGTTVSTVDTQYAPCPCSPLGKLSAVSQPYAPGQTPVWTTYVYDGSGRTLSVTFTGFIEPSTGQPDTAGTTTYLYQGNTTKVTDPAGRWKSSTVDAYGNLVQVTEPNPAGGNFQTNYTYDWANRLTLVSMIRGNVTQTRTFVYTGSDLTSSTNPENGTLNYTYDLAHHVTSRTDALGQLTDYNYDPYGRLSYVQYFPSGAGNGEDLAQRVTYYYDNSYPGTLRPPVQAPYNGMGRLTAVTFADGGRLDSFGDVYTYAYAYTPPGRVSSQTMTVGFYSPQYPTSYLGSRFLTFNAAYQWDTEGRMTSLQYPSVLALGNFGNQPVPMPTATYQYDPNGRLNEIDMNGGWLASATYTTAGQLNQLTYGAGTETRTYNSLNQLISQVVPGYLNMIYTYSTTQNNGRITSSSDGITGETTNYTYDALNRLTAASNSLWSQTYGYGGFGNLTSKSQANGSPNPSPAINVTYDANNHQNGVGYDANGNVNVGAPYSVENRMVSEWGGVEQYAYDPWGKRVMNGSNPDPYNLNDEWDPLYSYNFYGITGQKLATVTCDGKNYPQQWPTCSIVGQNVYFGSKLLISGGVPVVTDRLGSVRANTQGEFFAYYPYGEERTNTADGREKFGTYFRDGVGQDYAEQRYYNAGVARFWSPDPGGIKTADATDPGSWNRYAYVGGDPVNYLDRAGTSRESPTFCDVYPDDPSCDPWYEPFDQSQGQKKPQSKPCSFSAQDLQNYMLNTPAWDAHGNAIATGAAARPLADYAATIMAEAVADNVDPRLIVAIAFDEGKWGGDSDAAATDNSFGLHNATGGLANFTNAGGWATGIGEAAATVEGMMMDGLTSVGQLYSGKKGAYCQGPTCATRGTDVVTAKLKAMGGSPVSLASPCHKGDDGKYYANQ